MKQLDYTEFNSGGRISMPKFRNQLAEIEYEEGLEADVERYELLTLVKRVGKQLGFTPRMIQLLDYYMSFTRDCDWEQGARPIVFQSVSKTAMDLGVSERQVQNLEQSLFKAGAITWNDSGNHRRYGTRDERTGKLLFAFGVDLTPLAKLKAVLEHKLHEKKLYDSAWQDSKRKISWYRRQIRAFIAELSERVGGCNLSSQYESCYEQIATPIRTYMSLEVLRALQADHKALFDKLENELNSSSVLCLFNRLSSKTSSIGEINFVHLNITTQKQTDKSVQSNPPDLCLQEGVPQIQSLQFHSEDNMEDSDNVFRSSGVEYINLRQAVNSASARFLDHMAIQQPTGTWNAFVDAAYTLKSELGISQSAWIEACQNLGRIGAAICVLITDRHMQREIDPVKRPGGYFRGMIAKARVGELRLHSSIFGILNASDERDKH